MLAAPSCHPALRQGVGLQPFTTWKVGGPAEWFAEPEESDELVSLAAWVYFYYYVDICVSFRVLMY